jgi:arylformamidase
MWKIRFHVNKNSVSTIFMLLLTASLLSACDKVAAISQKIKHHFFASQAASEKINIASDVNVIHDFSYGHHAKQRMDIYTPQHAKNAPVIMMLHGGGWGAGDKSDALVYINKVNRWVPKGFIVISVNTRLLPEADVYGQIKDFAQAVATAQQHATEWGGNPDLLMLMGHSSGGTIVSVLSTTPALVTNIGGKRWLATFALDSSSLDIPRTMRLWHPDMFVVAYSDHQEKWPAASPIDLVNAQSIPMFIACSTQRPDSPCEQAQLFSERAKAFNIRMTISTHNLNHGEMNDALGIEPQYTMAVETFMASLDKTLAARLFSQKE